jgi:hypothetical protein
VALVVGNANYPGDDRPPCTPIKDVRAIAEELRRGLRVITGKTSANEAAVAARQLQGKDQAGVDRARFQRLRHPDRQTILHHSRRRPNLDRGEVKRDGISIESVLADMNAAGAAVKLVIVDAARRSIRAAFRGLSIGLAPLTAPAERSPSFPQRPTKS